MHGSGLNDLVGREEELELLLRRWSKAKSGDGQVVLFSGEASIGKSRLTAALLERLASEPHTRLRYFCSPWVPTYGDRLACDHPLVSGALTRRTGSERVELSAVWYSCRATGTGSLGCYNEFIGQFPVDYEIR